MLCVSLSLLFPFLPSPKYSLDKVCSYFNNELKVYYDSIIVAEPLRMYMYMYMYNSIIIIIIMFINKL